MIFTSNKVTNFAPVKIGVFTIVICLKKTLIEI